MPNIYIIAGCNGAGKTTASFTVLPEMLDCHEFINSDEIAKGLSPLNYSNAAIESGKIMLKKINQLIEKGVDFAFETTLAAKVFVRTIKKAKKAGYHVTLLFFWLDSVQLANERVKNRVLEGGHDVKPEVVKRRYYAGLKNLFELYLPICDYWMLFDNSRIHSELIAEGYKGNSMDIKNNIIFDAIKLNTFYDG